MNGASRTPAPALTAPMLWLREAEVPSSIDGTWVHVLSCTEPASPFPLPKPPPSPSNNRKKENCTEHPILNC